MGYTNQGIALRIERLFRYKDSIKMIWNPTTSSLVALPQVSYLCPPVENLEFFRSFQHCPRKGLQRLVRCLLPRRLLSFYSSTTNLVGGLTANQSDQSWPAVHQPNFKKSETWYGGHMLFMFKMCQPRANGASVTNARWIRNFVQQHFDYKKDSRV